jgi:hypothetical protein
VEAPRFSFGFTPIVHATSATAKGALRNEMIWLKVGLLVTICPIESAQGDHVFGNWFSRLPRSKAPITNDTRRDAIQIRDRVTIKAIEGIAILLEELCNVARHGSTPN